MESKTRLMARKLRLSITSLDTYILNVSTFEDVIKNWSKQKIIKMNRIIILLAISVLSLSAFGQTSRGTVTGTITDATGAVISGASVTLTNTGTNVSRSTITNKEGFYRLDAVDLGDHKVKIIAQGFSEITKTGIIVAANLTATIDAQLSVGTQEIVVDVTSESGANLQTESVVRGGSINTKSISELPISTLNPTQLALTMPGVSTNRFGMGQSTYSINGSRGRSNNFLIDGTENNDISVAGQAFELKIPDAVSEVSVQTSNFDAEFGRAGGGVFNTITKSGTNQYHGTVSWRYDSTRDDAITNTQVINKEVQKRGYPLYGTEHTFTGTIGGPIIKDKTFFFAAFMDQRLASNPTATVFVPTAAGSKALRDLFPQGINTSVDRYLEATSGVIGTSNISNIALGKDAFGNDRPSIEFGNGSSVFKQTRTQPQLISKVDHKFSEKSQLSGRFLFDQTENPVGGATFGLPGFTTSFKARNQNVLISETHIFSPTITNEVRLSYNRITQEYPLDPPIALAQGMSRTAIQGITDLTGNTYDFGIATNLPQGRIANNYILQDTVTKIVGNHTFRTGFDLLKQKSRQAAPFNARGSYTYNAGGGFTGFANFIDDYSGNGGSINRDFGSAFYYPEMFRQAYFVQDRWKATQSLTLTLGLRYENFDTPINSIRTPAFTGLHNIKVDLANNTLTGPYSEPNKVKRDNNNFAPTVGVAYLPSYNDGVLGYIFGQQKTVVRLGYQIGYDSGFNNMISNAIASTPNNIATQFPGSTVGRGTGNFSSNMPIKASTISPFDNQSLVDAELVNPYTQRWSFGIQRELPSQFMLDISYVGTKGTKLYLSEDRNPIVPKSMQIIPEGYIPAGYTGKNSNRLDPLQGSRRIRSNSGSSIYHAAQAQLTRRFTNNFTVTGSYTFSKMIDNGSEIFAFTGLSSHEFSAIPQILGGERRDRAVSIFDRTHRGAITYIYSFPFMKDQKGVLGQLAGGWQVSGVTSFETGVPFTVLNGVDSDGIGVYSNINMALNDRPDFNPNGQAGVRAIVATPTNSISGTGYVNPDVIIGKSTDGKNNNIYDAINPANARYIQVPGGSGRTGNLGRNTERTKGINNFDFNVQKQFKIREGIGIQFRTEFFNIFNHPQFGVASVSPFSPSTSGPSANVTNTPAGRFLQPQIGDGGGRVIRYYLRLSF